MKNKIDYLNLGFFSIIEFTEYDTTEIEFITIYYSESIFRLVKIYF